MSTGPSAGSRSSSPACSAGTAPDRRPSRRRPAGACGRRGRCGARRRLDRPRGVAAVEDVVVLVERRAVANLEAVLDELRPLRQRRERRELRRRQHALRPLDGLPRHVVEERRGLQAGADLVVVAADDPDRGQLERAFDGRRRIGAVADQIAQARARRRSRRGARRRAPPRGRAGCPWMSLRTR